MSLIRCENPKPYKLPPLTAASVRMVDLKQGDRFRIADTEHKHAGRSGVLELSGGKIYMLIDGQYCAVKPEQLVPASLRAVK